jgi:probable HAF family extracellular repeat protein
LGGTYSAAINCSIPGPRIVGESSVTDDSATHAVLWDNHVINDLGTLGGTEGRALFPLGIFGESRTVEGDLHPTRWSQGRISDFAHVLGAESQIESVVPLTGDVTNAVVSGAASPGADVHAYIVSVPRIPMSPRTINDGVIEVIRRFPQVSRFVFTTGDVTAQLGSRTYFFDCQPCGAGNTVSLSQNILVIEDSSGLATVRGNEYHGQYGVVAMPQVQFRITADYVTIPTTGEQLITFSSPFTYSGVRPRSLANAWRDIR